MRKFMDIINESENVDEGAKDFAMAAGAGVAALGAAHAVSSVESPAKPEVEMGIAHDDHEHLDTSLHSDLEKEGAVKGGKKGSYSFLYWRADEDASDEIVLDGQSISVWSNGSEAIHPIRAEVAIKDGFIFVGWQEELSQGLHNVALPGGRSLNLRVN